MDSSSYCNALWQHHDTKYNSHKELPRKTWIEVFLGEDALRCEGGEAFTVRYMIKAHLPCVMFASTRTTGTPGSHVSITRCARGELLSGRLIVPLRIVMDLMLVLLTHNTRRYTDAYHYTWWDTYVPVVGGRECDSHKLGCCHMVMMSAGEMDTHLETTEHTCGSVTTVGDKQKASLPALPVPDREHMGLNGVEDIRSGIVRHPCGTIFLTTSGWGIVTGRGLQSMMGVPGDRQTQYAFPLCHTEHLPGLLAVFNKWLDDDYKRYGLKITTVLPSAVSSVKTPDLRYKNKMDYWVDQCHRVHCIDGTQQAMRRTVYDGDDLSVHPYSAYRKNISKCKMSK